MFCDQVTSFDDKDTIPVVHRPLDSASSSVHGSSRIPMTSLVTVAVFALATSVGVTSLCVQLVEANVTIRIPRSLKLGRTLKLVLCLFNLRSLICFVKNCPSA
jgi:hypothetical protein